MSLFDVCETTRFVPHPFSLLAGPKLAPFFIQRKSRVALFGLDFDLVAVGGLRTRSLGARERVAAETMDGKTVLYPKRERIRKEFASVPFLPA